MIKPWECKVFGTACTPEHAIGTCMVSPEGACAAYYNYGRYARDRGRGGRRVSAPETQAPSREQRILEIIETARSKRPRFKDERITMAHGAGGKATQTLIEGLLAPAFGSEALDELADAGACRVDGVGLALTTDTFVVKPLRFPGGSIGELAVNGTVNDLAAAGARPLAISLALVLEEGLEADVLRAEVEAIAAAAAARRGRGDHRRHEGGRARARRRHVREHERDRPATPARGSRPRRFSRAIGSWSRGRSASTGPRSCSPAASSGSTPRSGPTRVRCGRSPTRCSTLPGRELRTMRDATRGGVATVLNELARASGVGVSFARPRSRCRRRSPGACELLGIDPMYVANEGVMVAFVAPEAAERGAGGAALGTRVRGGGGDCGGPGGAARDGVGRDGVRRPAGDGPAGRRSAAENLLNGQRGELRWP